MLLSLIAALLPLSLLLPRIVANSAQQQHAQQFGYSDFDFWRMDQNLLEMDRRKCKDDDNDEDDDDVRTRITGGNLAERNMFPYQAALLLLQAPKVIQCGGALISQRFVLTAAHCLFSSTKGIVFLGTNIFADRRTATAIFNVTARDFYIYEQYREGTGRDDIALIYLQSAVPLTPAVQTIPLARRYMTQSFLEAEIVTTSGWGQRSDLGRLPTENENYLLYFLDAPVMTTLQCSCYYLPGLVRPQSHLCTDGNGGRGSCDGDSGGPLTYYHRGAIYLVGITSFGSAGGCEIGFPSVYTRITQYLGWIARRTGLQIE